MSYRRAVIDQLESNGYKKLPAKRGKGSHELWKRDVPPPTHIQTVPRKVDDRNFANEIMKESGINHRFK